MANILLSKRLSLVALRFSNCFFDRFKALILQLLSVFNWWLLNKNSSLDHFWFLRFNDELATWLRRFFWRKKLAKVVIRRCRNISNQEFDSGEPSFFLFRLGTFRVLFMVNIYTLFKVFIDFFFRCLVGSTGAGIRFHW